MFSSPTPAPGSRAIAASALRNAGLIEKDTTMRDADHPGGKKTTARRSRKIRGIDSAKDEALGTSQRSRAIRPTSSASHAGPSDPLYIRGAGRISLTERRRRVAEPIKVVDAWRELVHARYNPEQKFLNLEKLIDDPLVKKNNLNPPGHGGDARTAAVIFKIVGQLQPKVETLSLANNKISGKHLVSLDRYVPTIRNLSLQNTALTSWSDIDAISGRNKMTDLRELVLMGTPLYNMELRNDRLESYRSTIARRWVGLRILDSEVITRIGFVDDAVNTPAAPVAVVETPHGTTFPFEMGLSFITGVDGNFVSGFLLRYFNFFDTVRAQLGDVYDAQATFSYSCNTSIPARARIRGLHQAMPHQKKLTWESWLSAPGNSSRNLSRPQMATREKVVSAMHIGPEDIVKSQSTLPMTKHDVQGSERKFIVDAFPVELSETNAALMVIVHGEFMEKTQGVRSFDRTFILVPAPEGSRARLAGWDAVILSDQWTIRGYSSPDIWIPGPMLVYAQPRPARKQEFSIASLPVDQQQAINTLPELQRNLVLEVCGRTRLTASYAVDCLTNNDWDLERAVSKFEQVKATLPKDAFL